MKENVLDGCDPNQSLLMKEDCLEVDENDNFIGPISKLNCHLMENINKGTLHRAFSVFLFNSEKKLLIQQRSDKKITFPNFFTNTCCSHPLMKKDEREEEDFIGIKRAAIRKLNQELGISRNALSVEDFKCLTRIHYKATSNGKWGEHEIDYVLFVTKDVELNINHNEVKKCFYLNKIELMNFISDDNQLTPWFKLIIDHFLWDWWDNHNILTYDQRIHKFSKVSIFESMPVDQICYSDKYFDDQYEFRHVILPADIARLAPKDKLMSEEEWRSIGVQQSQGWVHYMIHRPEPHILCFRRILSK